jgi:predicted nucleic acid-binding protein
VFILDTMVVSERTKTRPDPAVCAWLAAIEPQQQFISVITIGEIRFGIDRMREGSHKRRLEIWFDELVPFFTGRILPIDVTVGKRWGRLKYDAGRSVSAADGLIGATALVHNLAVATRNEYDFADFGLRVVNPWLA